jgi:alpha-glucosidase
MKNTFLFILNFIFIGTLSAQKQKPAVEVISPNTKIKFVLKIINQAVQYEVFFENNSIITPSKLSLDFLENGQFGEDVVIKKSKIQEKKENYTLVVGKVKQVQSVYNEALIEFQETKKSKRKINIIIRAYDDALAFRYEFPKQGNESSWTLTNENSTFNLSQNPLVYTLLHDNYLSSHEGLYSKIQLNDIPKDKLMDMPSLFEFQGTNHKKVYLSITEAALLNYPGMYLAKSNEGFLVSKLSPLPNQTQKKAILKLPHKSPWRVMMLGNEMATLMESNILTNLNEDPKNKDWSWLKPGKTDFTWWNGDVLNNVDFPVGLNFETHKYYIDFCAANGIDFHSVVSFGNFAWYQGEQEGFDPASPNADVTKPLEALQMDKLAAYSREKGVGLRVWVNWKSLERKIDEAFPLFKKWNIKGLMVDFMDRDDQEMVNFVEEVLQKAAKYHLHIQFHGAYKPTGLARTYPNELTKEGVLNLENLKWASDCDPEHNLMVPFTRMLAGPMDYHSGGFRSLPRKKYTVNFTAPNVLGTRCHHLAMAVVYESYLQMLCDYPAAYENQLGFEFLQQVPTIWDEMKVLNAQIGDFLTIARRKDSEWYIGTMNDWSPRSLEIKLDFLPAGKFVAMIYEDNVETEKDSNQLTKRSQVFTNQDVIKVNLASGGGQAIWLKELK